MTPYELWSSKKPQLSFLKVWDCDAYVKKFQHDKLEPKSEKQVFIGYPKINYWVHLLSQIRRQDFLLLNWILSREGVSLERSDGRKVELDKVIVPSPELEISSSHKSVPVMPTPISEEVNDDDHETSDQVITEPRRSTKAHTAPVW